ncbi:MAG TPA: tetratricopeptide repeat protein [Desulfuromonadaceae bacterium]|jgi:tetratricopeptide (TPR) repeat protein
MQQGESFWSDIKNYEEQLSKNPNSYLFAKLAEIYLKVGLIDDALHTARQGVAQYPNFIAGQRALAMACQSKGLLDECREALKKVTAAQPEDGEAQKMLGRIFVGEGNKEAAVRAFSTMLEFNPDDVECRLELDGLEKVASTTAKEDVQAVPMNPNIPAADLLDVQFAPFEEGEEFDEIIEDLEIIEVDESDLVEVDESGLTATDLLKAETPAKHDPLSTVTLAELYVQQGFTDKALEIYRSILNEDPENNDVLSRLTELESKSQTEKQPVSATMEFIEEASLNQAMQAQELPEPPTQGQPDQAVLVLEEWLDNIRRMKACR